MAFGAWLGGRLYDVSGNYEAMWIAAILFGLLATVIHLPIREQAGRLAQANFSNSGSNYENRYFYCLIVVLLFCIRTKLSKNSSR